MLDLDATDSSYELPTERSQEMHVAKPSVEDVTGPMAPADAMWLWFSAKFPTDQFIVFAFDGEPASVADAVASTLDRARAIPYLTVRIREDKYGLRFPRWEHVGVTPDQCLVHELDAPAWTGCLDALATLAKQQLDPRVAAWRLHVFSPVLDVPRTDGPATVVALQINHTLGDGTRTAVLAGALFGRDAMPAPIEARPAGSLMRGVVATLRARRARARDTAAGKVPAEKGPVPTLSVNGRPSGTRVFRTVVRNKSQLPGPTATIGAMVAISDALSGYLQDRGEDTSQLTAAVPVARSGVAQSYNHLDLTWIGFHNDAASRDEQIRRIVGDLAAWRRRSQHPSFAVEAAASVAVPAPVRRIGISLIKTDIQPATVPAHTMVSSVNRGPADLTFGGRPVVLTTGFPALVPISSLAHGVHHIGDTVVVSVHASTPQVDVDDYLARLDAALPQ